VNESSKKELAIPSAMLPSEDMELGVYSVPNR
jgi:hypothetical protein